MDYRAQPDYLTTDYRLLTTDYPPKMNSLQSNTLWIGRSKNFTVALNEEKTALPFIGTKTNSGYEIECRNIIPFLNRDEEYPPTFLRPGIYVSFDKSFKKVAYKADAEVLKPKAIFFGCLALLLLTLSFPYGNLVWVILPVYFGLFATVFLFRFLRMVMLVKKHLG